MTSSHVSLVDDFRRFFSICLATTPEQRLAAYRLRYRVYCQELRYENPELFPNGAESDAFDERSLHCLVIHRRSGLAAGCVRLVQSPGELHETPLPMEKHCAHALDPATIGFMKHNRKTLCEISRLAVDPRFRRRTGEQRNQLGEIGAFDVCDQEQRSFSLVATAAFMAATALTELTDCNNIFAMMDVSLPQILSRIGLHFQRAGDEIEYHGRRAPYYITTESALAKMHPELKQFYLEIYNGLARSYAGMNMRVVAG